MISCEKEKEISAKLSSIIVNKTKHVLFYVLESTEGIDSIFVNPNDSATLSFVKNRNIKTSILGQTTQGIGWLSETIYDLSDTTSFSPNEIYGNDLNYKDSLYNSQITIFREENPDLQEIRKIIYSDTFKSIMNKNLSMLEQFPNYYK